MSEPSLRVPVPGTAAEYPVHIAAGAFERLGDLVADAAPAHRYAVVADATVAELYGAAALEALSGAGLRADLLTFPAGEASKSRAVWAELTDRMLAGGFGRDAAVVALGGGVTGDLAGFTASTFMRGLPLVAVPTSLLAMLDSSVGGKTALDAPAAKNAVGTFHHPRLVVIDPELLASLPRDHLRAGLAEAVKMAAIADADLFGWIEAEAAGLRAGHPARLGRLIEACVRRKAEVVAEDPAERGVRQVLNFGHTAGHALEALSGFRLLHGEAVGQGLRIEARLGEAARITRPGVAARLDRTLDACGLPEPDSSPSASRLLEAAAADKKARRDTLRWILLEDIGRVGRDADGSWSHALAPDRLERWLDAALRPAVDVRDSAP